VTAHHWLRYPLLSAGERRMKLRRNRFPDVAAAAVPLVLLAAIFSDSVDCQSVDRLTRPWGAGMRIHLERVSGRPFRYVQGGVHTSVFLSYRTARHVSARLGVGLASHSRDSVESPEADGLGMPMIVESGRGGMATFLSGYLGGQYELRAAESALVPYVGQRLVVVLELPAYHGGWGLGIGCGLRWRVSSFVGMEVGADASWMRIASEIGSRTYWDSGFSISSGIGVVLNP
jgi:hypothetical protein